MLLILVCSHTCFLWAITIVSVCKIQSLAKVSGIYLTDSHILASRFVRSTVQISQALGNHPLPVLRLPLDGHHVQAYTHTTAKIMTTEEEKR